MKTPENSDQSRLHKNIFKYKTVFHNLNIFKIENMCLSIFVLLFLSCSCVYYLISFTPNDPLLSYNSFFY